MTLNTDISALRQKNRDAMVELQNQNIPSLTDAEREVLITEFQRLQDVETALLHLKTIAGAQALQQATAPLHKANLDAQRNVIENVLSGLGGVISGAVGDALSHSATLGPAAGAVDGNIDAFAAFLAEQIGQLNYFTAQEFFIKGSQHHGTGECAGLNTDPPKDLWPNILPLVRVLDEFRNRIGAPVNLRNVYRSPAYNACIGGVSQSQHMQFKATDIAVTSGPTRSEDWHALLRTMRDEGLFSGGLGLYNTFVHVDVRGHIADWDNR